MAVFLDRAHLWDIAAGAAIIKAAGGTLWYLEGTGDVLAGDLLDQGTLLKPLLGAHPSVIDRLPAYIEPILSA
jgi:fructose-1,6-bisphosphatase/inositol monophosphatase family enzyme